MRGCRIWSECCPGWPAAKSWTEPDFAANTIFTLSYAPDRGDAGREGSNASPAADGFPDSVFTALRSQLGLNLEARKSQFEFIVVDRLDRLIPN